MKRIFCLRVACVLGVFAGSGCAWHGDDLDEPAVLPPAGAVVASPFSPASVRIFPLTHFEVSETGEALIMVFIELKDQWGDTVKGAGTLELQLYRPEGGAANRETRELVWEIDLSDLDRNAAMYDPSTRTYRVALKDLPPWLASMVRGGVSEPSWVALEVYFKTVGADGLRLTLRDRFVLSGG